MADKYDFQGIERKWHGRWEKANLYATKSDPGKPKYYYLDMFPYPSGELHMGHMRNYVIGDVVSRYEVMKGFNVLHPMGFDSFGLPAENAAIEKGVHPAKWTTDCIARMKQQFDKLGISFDWSREVITCLPEYYRWNQWFFLKFLERGLAYKKMAPANWCPTCETVLANEEAEGGVCWRCESAVTRRDIEQWFFRITDYADRLLEDIDLLDNWPERVRAMQRNWIGRSDGVVIHFKVADTGDDMPVYTTRQDTVYGVTYMVLAPEHPLVEKLTAGTKYEADVETFVAQVRTLSEIERLSTTLEKVGMFIGAHAVNPMSGEKVPIWITNYVLREYGTGAVMGVPAHDQRDFEFAKKYDLPIRQVIAPPADVEANPKSAELVGAYIEPGVQVNSGPFDGIPSERAKEAIADYMEEHKTGYRQVNYRLRDWLVSRQRYWGTPIPIVYCEKCGMVPVPEDQLPVILPTDVKFTGRGESPLTTSPTFLHTDCPKCGGKARRETDTMATWIDSSWYFLRYASPHEDKLPFDPRAAGFWLPVDQYVGGVEHAVLHLLYSRFFTKVIHDLGLIKFSEPFSRLFTQGMIYKDGFKMSKSRGNVVSADYVCAKYGADALRMFILFIGPPDQDAEWSDQGIEGVFRYLNRVWRFFTSNLGCYDPNWREALKGADLSKPERDLRRKTHQTIQRVTSDIERFHFNTAVSALMELVNEMVDFQTAEPHRRPLPEAERGGAPPSRVGHGAGGLGRSTVLSEAMENVILLLGPFAPHIADELWERLGKKATTYEQAWLEYAPAIAKAEEVTIVLQINGKVRDRIQVPVDTDRAELERLALESDRMKAFLDNKPIRKVIVVPGKLVNVVV
ncbi:MAG TPA: leucine--tRNA ligase [Armatimonadota bacterium]|nr:leucine--tRNA ligase [Armatimonadota bacterium]